MEKKVVFIVQSYVLLKTVIAKRKLKKKLQRELIPGFSIPLPLDSNKGTHLAGQAVQTNCAALQKEPKCPCAHRPQSSGAVEKKNSDFKTKLAKKLCGGWPEMSGCVCISH